LGSQIRDTTKNIGADWKEIGDGRKESNQEKEKWKQFQRKKKSGKKIQELENGQKKMMTRWAI